MYEEILLTVVFVVAEESHTRYIIYMSKLNTVTNSMYDTSVPAYHGIDNLNYILEQQNFYHIFVFIVTQS
jgi:hypothetical protein